MRRTEGAIRMRRTEGAVRLWRMQKELYGCGYNLAGMQFAGCNVLNVQC